MSKRNFRVWRGEGEKGELVDYSVEVDKGMVVLDAVHKIQTEHAGDLAARWNCKAGKCGSCSVEINGKPRLGCMTRLNEFKEDETITITPVKTFPTIKDLVTDVSWNYEQNQRIKPFKPRPREADGNHYMMQRDVDRIQEFRKCIECYLCQNVCHVLRDNDKKDKFVYRNLICFHKLLCVMREFDIGYPHSQTPRVLLAGARTIQNKIAAWELDQEYYDGARGNGYGGFSYDGRWAKIIPSVIKEYGLNAQSSVLDVGCKKGFFMHDLTLLLPGIKVYGVEDHKYPIMNSMKSVRNNIKFLLNL